MNAWIAGARPRKDDDGTLESLGDSPLLVVEPVESVLRLHRGDGNVTG